MLKKTVTYKDFDDVERTEDFYFNLTEAEITDMNLDENANLAEKIQSIINSKDMKQIKDYFQWIVLKAYGVKSDDGRKFMKSPEIIADFKATQAYSDIWMELAYDADAASEFVNGIMPKNLVAQIEENKDKVPLAPVQ